jgi:hypothetical protein
MLCEHGGTNCRLQVTRLQPGRPACTTRSVAAAASAGAVAVLAGTPVAALAGVAAGLVTCLAASRPLPLATLERADGSCHTPALTASCHTVGFRPHISISLPVSDPCCCRCCCRCCCCCCCCCSLPRSASADGGVVEPHQQPGAHAGAERSGDAGGPAGVNIHRTSTRAVRPGPCVANAPLAQLRKLNLCWTAALTEGPLGCAVQDMCIQCEQVHVCTARGALSTANVYVVVKTQRSCPAVT